MKTIQIKLLPCNEIINIKTFFMPSKSQLKRYAEKIFATSSEIEEILFYNNDEMIGRCIK